MGKLSYDDIKSIIEFNNESEAAGYEFPLMERFNKVVGNIEGDQISVISGLPSAGTTSFIDQNYVMSPLLQWYNQDPHERQGLKVIYYSMKDSEAKKLEGLLCNYLKLVHNIRTDIPTLNNQAGKLYNLKDDSVLQNAIEAASPFFDEILDDEVLVIKSGQQKPSTIFNDMVDFMETIGSENSNKEYERDDKHVDDLIMLVVDSTDYLLNDTDGFGTVSGQALHEKMQHFMRILKLKYGLNIVLAAPSIIPIIRTPKDTEPHFRHLGTYGKIADKGICIYNPVAEKNNKFYPDEDVYRTAKGNILLRTWHVVKNVDGIESVWDRMFFIPGTSYLIEHSQIKQGNDVIDLQDVLDVLEEPTVFSDLNASDND